KQAMGMVTPQVSKAPQAFWKQAIETVSERLSNLLLRILHDSGAKKLDPALILFPCEFERLALGLKPFMGKAFQENPYQETPILRGLFFTSGRQEGTPYSHFLHKIGLLGEKEVLQGTNRGMFLHDFFAKILPMDRGIFAPTRRVLEWRRLSRNLGLTSWVALVVAFCVLMSFSFVKNLSTMREVPKEFLESPIIRGDLLLDVVSLDQYQQAILKVEATNKNWWIPRFGLHESIDVEEQLKDNFNQQFRKSFLQPLDTKMSGRMANFTVATPNHVISRHISHLVRRINLLNHRLKTDEKQTFLDKPQTSFLVMMSQEQGQMIPEIRKKMASMYLHYLLWNKDDSQINLERNELQAWLKQTLAIKENQLDWLVVWANEQDDLRSVSLEDFWGGSQVDSDAVFVAPAFTKNGKEYIDAFVVELEAALPFPGSILLARQKIDFGDFYRNQFMAEWRNFALGFNQGAERLAGYEEWLPMAQRISSLSGPYFSLLDQMVDELGFVAGMEQFPDWISLVLQHQAVLGQSAVLAKAEGGAFMAKAGMKSKSLIGKLGSKLDTSVANDTLDNQIKAARALLNYQKALKETMVSFVPRKAAFSAAAAVFEDEKTALSTASQAVATMKTYMTSGKEAEEVFWKLLTGPIDFLWSFERTEAACYLQERWDKEVYVEIQGVQDKQKVLQLLLDQDGYAMQFIKGPAAPFLSRNPKKGYYPLTALDGSVAFEPGFLDFLTRGVSVKRSRRPSYDVTIKGLPTGVNSEAHIKPHATHVELECASENQKLSNFQFPTRQKFHWTRESCGDVLFEIEVSDMLLTKVYRGSQAFPAFLNDFKTGKKNFYPRDFPEHRASLKRLGIKYIRVNYKFAGHQPVLELIRATPGAVPTRIVQCWD
ncbi:MAG: type VI secretion system protein ImpL, partial [Desulfobulbaceae bacterium]|nr:type VI secretion system protein ImpL [Desulfobulbaceae bacterium]